MVATPILLVLITGLDSSAVAARTAFGQPLAALCTDLFWLFLFRRAGRRLRLLMLLGLIAATAGELLFSVGLGLYRYRLGGVPLYVPPGHAILYAAIFGFVRMRSVRRHARVVSALLFAACTAYSAGWFFVHDDLFGLSCFALFALLWLANAHGRMFFAAMYLLVGFLEQTGTRFGCWRWPDMLLGRISAVPSANPPSGVALFYVLFDLSCLALYFFVRWSSFERWVRRKVAVRRYREGVSPPG